jgi:hypothetical protein
MLVMLSAALPVLLKVTACGGLVVPTVWLLKVKLVGDKDTAGDPLDVPEPIRLTVCGLLLALSLTVIVPVSVPVVVGLNVTLIVQLAPAAKLEPQLFVSAKLALVAMLLIVRLVVPVLVSVTGCAVLVVPTV